MAVWIAPHCPPEVADVIRREARARGEIVLQQVLPDRPFASWVDDPPEVQGELFLPSRCGR